MAVLRDCAAPWGKTGAAHTHHLAHHCADVAACFEAICALPVVRARLETAAGRKLVSLDIVRLCALVFLHDCGKLHPGFQAKAWPLAVGPDRVGHLVAGAAIFDRDAREGAEIARTLNIGALAAWGVDACLLYAVLAHHGRPFKFDHDARRGWRRVEAIGYDLLAMSQATLADGAGRA